MLGKLITIGNIGILPNGVLQIREDTRIIEGGQTLSTTYHRWTLAPGDDLAGQAAEVQAMANAVWTPEVVAAYQAALVLSAPAQI